MNTLQNILFAVGGLAFGTLAAYVNYRVSRKGVKHTTMAAIMGTNAVRMLVDIAALLAAFFVGRLFGLSYLVTIVPVALGLSIFGMIFLRRLTKQFTEEEDNSKDGGE